jgi:hypothetical protein
MFALRHFSSFSLSMSRSEIVRSAVKLPLIFPNIIRYCQVLTKERYPTDVKDNDLRKVFLPFCFVFLSSKIGKQATQRILETVLWRRKMSSCHKAYENRMSITIGRTVMAMKWQQADVLVSVYMIWTFFIIVNQVNFLWKELCMLHRHHPIPRRLFILIVLLFLAMNSSLINWLCNAWEYKLFSFFIHIHTYTVAGMFII